MSSDDASATEIPTPDDLTRVSLRVPAYEDYYIRLSTDNRTAFIVDAVEEQIKEDGIDLETWNMMVQFVLSNHPQVTPENITEAFESPEELLETARMMVNQQIDEAIGDESGDGDSNSPPDDDDTTP